MKSGTGNDAETYWGLGQLSPNWKEDAYIS